MWQHDARPIETAQYMFMRTALAIHGEDMQRVVQTYNALSEQRILFPPHVYRQAGSPKGISPTTVTVLLDASSMDALRASLRILDNSWSIGIYTAIAVDDRLDHPPPRFSYADERDGGSVGRLFMTRAYRP